MLGKTHLVGGASLGLCASLLYFDPIHSFSAPAVILSATMVAAGALGSLLPDLDSPTSIAGRRVKLISWTLSKAFGHRGFTHTPLLTCLMAALLMMLTASIPADWQGLYLAFSGGLILGYASHLGLDLLTVEGIPLLYPLSSRKTHLLRLRTGERESIVRFLLILLTGLFVCTRFFV